MKVKRILYWLPRVLAIIFIMFISVFAFDVFGEPQWFLALLMHLIPSFIITLLTVIAWKHGIVGGWLFLATGLVMAMFFHSMIIATPAIVIGVLFLMENHGGVNSVSRGKSIRLHK